MTKFPGRPEPRRGNPKPAQVVIAHQSAIPSYRVRFYELLENIRPADWEFKVVFNPLQNAENAGHAGNLTQFNFPVIEAPIISLRLPLLRNLKWQGFLWEARRADVLILDTLLSNITYPVAAVTRQSSTRLILWGHTNNLNRTDNSLYTKIAVDIKRKYLTRCDAFFAYTSGEGVVANKLGLSGRTTILNNTVDILSHRSRYLNLRSSREAIRRKLGFDSGSKVILVVGRLIPPRRIDFMLEAFRELVKHPDWRLIVVGGGPELSKVRAFEQIVGKDKIMVTGAVSDVERLAEYYIASDAFVLPGLVGLAPLEAICYELPVFAFSLPIHSPEIEYLTPENSVILPQSTTPIGFAQFLSQFINGDSAENDVVNRYESISHLTLENMTATFCDAVSEVIDRTQTARR